MTVDVAVLRRTGVSTAHYFRAIAGLVAESLLRTSHSRNNKEQSPCDYDKHCNTVKESIQSLKSLKPIDLACQTFEILQDIDDESSRQSRDEVLILENLLEYSRKLIGYSLSGINLSSFLGLIRILFREYMNARSGSSTNKSGGQVGYPASSAGTFISSPTQNAAEKYCTPAATLFALQRRGLQPVSPKTETKNATKMSDDQPDTTARGSFTSRGSRQSCSSWTKPECQMNPISHSSKRSWGTSNSALSPITVFN